jgi:hypothetical protein
VTEAGDYRIFAGWRSDPFFFDTMGALNNLKFTGDDFFIEKDVCTIVLEVPNSALGNKKIGLWHRTVDGASGKWVQADRGALPSQSIFLTGEKKGDYMAGAPADDARFTRVAGTLLPDILHYDPKLPASYPDNGRNLSDDVMDLFISTISNGKVKTDNVGPHKDLLASFPYLGSPHKAGSVAVAGA